MSFFDVSTKSLGTQINCFRYEANRLSGDLQESAFITVALLKECFQEARSTDDPKRLEVLQVRFEYLIDQLSSKIDEIVGVTNKLTELQTVT